jgi:DNA (cytosine-5)-methyltransferase 1
VRPRLLDLFCCQGGASMGYHRAGFDVVGVDCAEQPGYPFEFHQGDALTYLADSYWDFDAIHASPPCHDHSDLAHRTGTDGTGDLLAATLDALARLDIPWVVENVEGAPMPGALVLCGTEFGLSAMTKTGRRWLRRHRLFASNRLLMGAGGCSCSMRPIVGVYGTGGGGQMTRGYKSTKAEAEEALGIDWMDRYGLSQAIPPAYTEFIGAQLLDALRAAA